jgi:hypothetical protein
MHVHISWLTAIVYLLSWLVTVGVVNLFYRTHPSAFGASAWANVASPC